MQRFSLVEVIIVISIIGILAAIIVPNVMAHLAKKEVQEAESTANLELHDYGLTKMFVVDGCQGYEFHGLGHSAQTKYFFVCPAGGPTITAMP